MSKKKKKKKKMKIDKDLVERASKILDLLENLKTKAHLTSDLVPVIARFAQEVRDEKDDLTDIVFNQNQKIGNLQEELEAERKLGDELVKHVKKCRCQEIERKEALTTHRKERKK